jgi:hypothetical protein
MKTLPRVATEMALHVLTYNLTRVINIMGPGSGHKRGRQFPSESRPPTGPVG